MTAGRKSISSNKDWCTPVVYVEAIKRFWGGRIGLDPCSNRYSVVGAEKEFILPEKDGLVEPWNSKTIYVNPPYGNDVLRKTKIKDWLRKCADAGRHGKSEVIALVPVATNTAHWKEHVFGEAAAVCFLKDTRLRFLENGADTGKGAPMACCLVYWGRRYKVFFDNFIEYGAVVDLRPLRRKDEVKSEG